MEDLNVCTHRLTMKYNCVLDKPDVGKAKIPLCKLPPDTFIFGLPSNAIEGGVKEALCHWPEYETGRSKKVLSKEESAWKKELPYERIKLNRIPDVVFGDSSGEQEDTQAIMCHAYRERHIQKMISREVARREKAKDKEERLASRRRVIIRKHVSTTEQPKLLWKMNKFMNIPSKYQRGEKQ